jgi:hypothetical protein
MAASASHNGGACPPTTKLTCGLGAVTVAQKCFSACSDPSDLTSCYSCLVAVFGDNLATCCPCLAYYAGVLGIPWIKINC